MPQTVRDAVLLQLADLSDSARSTAEAASVAGPLRPRVDRRSRRRGRPRGAARDRAAGRGEPGRATFRHPLSRDAVYEGIPWLRRRALHRELANAIEARGGHGTEVAAHWRAARDESRALDSMLVAVDELARVHAYSDATEVGRQGARALAEGVRGDERIATLERHASFAKLSGNSPRPPARSGRSWPRGGPAEPAGRWRTPSAGWRPSTSSRATARRAGGARVAAEAYTANGPPGEAAAERLIAAGPTCRAAATTRKRSS